MQTRKALGKGLASLIPNEPKIVTEESSELSTNTIDIESIVPNRMQPRKEFSEEALKDLTESIKKNGIIQPLVVTPPVNGRYELIAGERRLRASKAAGLTKVPVVIREADVESMLELALIENIQREDLNPIEEARAYKDLIESFDYTQEEVADRVSKSRSNVANTLRLLFLPKLIQEDIIVGRLSAGHARALLSISDLQLQLKLRERILNANLTVRDVEKIIQEEIRSTPSSGQRGKYKKPELSPQMRAVQEELTTQLGTKVKVNQFNNNKGGQIIIEYYSVQDLNRIYRGIITT